MVNTSFRVTALYDEQCRALPGLSWLGRAHLLIGEQQRQFEWTSLATFTILPNQLSQILQNRKNCTFQTYTQHGFMIIIRRVRENRNAVSKIWRIAGIWVSVSVERGRRWRHWPLLSSERRYRGGRLPASEWVTRRSKRCVHKACLFTWWSSTIYDDFTEFANAVLTPDRRSLYSWSYATDRMEVGANAVDLTPTPKKSCLDTSICHSVSSGCRLLLPLIIPCYCRPCRTILLQTS